MSLDGGEMNYELRPLTLAEILDAAFRLVQTEWRTLVGLSLLMQIPLIVLFDQASWLYDPFAQPFGTDEEPSADRILEMLGLGGLIGLAYLILYPLVAGAVTASVGNFYLGRRFSIREALSAGGRAIFRLVLAYFVYFMAVGAIMLVGGLIASFVGVGIWAALESLGTPGIVVGVLGGAVLVAFSLYWMFFLITVSSLLPPAIVLESKGIFASVSRAFQLGSTSKGRLIGVIFTAGMIVGIPVFGAQMMIGFVPYLGVLIWAGFQAIGFAFTTSVAVVLYFDLRCRAENYDLELLAEQVEAGPGLGER